MYDVEMAQRALERTSPEFQMMVQERARQRGVSAVDVVLETALTEAQQQAGEALYALREKQAGPRLRAV